MAGANSEIWQCASLLRNSISSDFPNIQYDWGDSLFSICCFCLVLSPAFPSVWFNMKFASIFLEFDVIVFLGSKTKKKLFGLQ
jgi:hypothetical protein